MHLKTIFNRINLIITADASVKKKLLFSHDTEFNLKSGTSCKFFLFRQEMKVSYLNVCNSLIENIHITCLLSYRNKFFLKLVTKFPVINSICHFAHCKWKKNSLQYKYNCIFFFSENKKLVFPFKVKNTCKGMNKIWNWRFCVIIKVWIITTAYSNHA